MTFNRKAYFLFRRAQFIRSVISRAAILSRFVKSISTLWRSISNFKNILKEKKIRINNIPVFCKKFDEVYGAICRIREETENISNLLRAFLDMIDALTSAYSTQDAQPQDDILLKLLDWIDEHYAEEITLANVSKYCGYNKNYFCKRFKELTAKRLSIF